MASAGCGSTKVWGCGADVDYTPVGAGNRAPKFWCATKLVATSVLSQAAALGMNAMSTNQMILICGRCLLGR